MFSKDFIEQFIFTAVELSMKHCWGGKHYLIYEFYSYSD